MPRKCIGCGATTPPHNVQCCPTCGKVFGKQDSDSASSNGSKLVMSKLIFKYLSVF